MDVGGLELGQARSQLEKRSAALVRVPVVFTAAGRSWRVTPDSLGVKVDWRAAVSDARRQGEGFGPLRGFVRLDVRFFGADVAPPTGVLEGALRLQLDRIAKAVDRRHREPAIRLRGLKPVVVPGRQGRVLDRSASARTLVRALAAFERGGPVPLPVRVEAPRLRPASLAPALAQVRRALAAPVRLTVGPTRFRLPRWRIAELLQLPADGRRAVRIGGPAANRWLTRLAKQVNRPPADADFIVHGSAVRVVPAQPGLALEGAATAQALLRAALRPVTRVARIAVAQTRARRTTAEARSMAITGLVSSYTTFFGGEPNRIHNVQLVSHLVDDHLIAPGETFSFNQATGDRTAAKGFREAPVIINGELQTGLGGGVCQVSTTVFNAAYEAGLKITERTNHALYISHYPQGRDATVNYPDVDLKFVNHTGHWLLLRTFVGSSELTVSLFGTPVRRRVVSETSPLVTTAAPAVVKTVDPTLRPGATVIDDYGSPALSTSVRRKVYDAAGRLLYDTTWYSSYRAQPEKLRVGPPKSPVKKGKPAGTTSTTTTTLTTTTPATTAPATTPAMTTPATTTPAMTTPATTTLP
ncbi:MAG: VanW family protein [Gaiellaceae bacterium]